MPPLRPFSIFVAAFIVLAAALALNNFSRLAPVPSGKPRLIAHRGVYHLFDRRGVGPHDCTARRSLPFRHAVFENTAASITGAFEAGAYMTEVDIAPASDGRIALFHDWTVDCRTDGSGDTRSFTLAGLKRLDIGHGYTADGGKTFPLRGKGRGLMPSLEEGLAASGGKPLVYNFKSNDPAEADLLLRLLKAAGRDPLAVGDAFYGGPGPVGRVRERVPGVWAFSPGEAKRCTASYLIYGWTGVLPSACRGGTLVLPVNLRFLAWGWPNRLLARIGAGGGRVVVTGPYRPGYAQAGITTPEEFAAVPLLFDGYVWAEDILAVNQAVTGN